MDSLELDPEIERFDPGDPVACVVTSNLHRRQLSVRQRARVAKRLANLPRGIQRRRKEEHCYRSEDRQAPPCVMCGGIYPMSDAVHIIDEKEWVRRIGHDVHSVRHGLLGRLARVGAV